MDKSITILSTFAQDKIINKDAGTERIVRGGPAFYISKVFEEEKLPFNLITASDAEVEILVEKGDEIGKLTKKPIVKKVDFIKIKVPFLLISTLLDDFDLSGAPSFKGKVFLDIQGYVRDGERFGGKKLFNPTVKVQSSIFCLKGTEEELNYIPRNWLASQKKKILVVTRGKGGGTAFIYGEKSDFDVKQKILSGDTIGAGDTHFAYVASRFIKKNDFLESIEYANSKTSDFLLSKSRD